MPHCHRIGSIIYCMRICSVGGGYEGGGGGEDREGQRVSVDWSCTIGVKLVKVLEWHY